MKRGVREHGFELRDGCANVIRLLMELERFRVVTDFHDDVSTFLRLRAEQLVKLTARLVRTYFLRELGKDRFELLFASGFYFQGRNDANRRVRLTAMNARARLVRGRHRAQDISITRVMFLSRVAECV